MRRHRRDRFVVRVPPEDAFELAGDPTQFPEFNPFVRVPERSGRVEAVGNVYHQVFGVGPVRLTTRWETTSVDPPNSADRPRPSPPWTTVEEGDLPVFGRWVSTSRYGPTAGGTVITHDLEYGVPNGIVGRVTDAFLMRPLLSIGFTWLGRRLRRWIEATAPASAYAARRNQ